MIFRKPYRNPGIIIYINRNRKTKKVMYYNESVESFSNLIERTML